VDTKRVLIALAVLTALALWLFGGKDEPAPPTQQAAKTAPQQVPRQYTPPSRTAEPRFDYRAPSPPQTQQPYPTTPWSDTRPGTWGEYASPADGWSNAPNYRFRPLTEGDRRRMASPDAAPYSSPPTGPRAPDSGSWADGRYRFPSPATGTGAAGRYEPPYEVPRWGTGTWGTEPDYAEQGRLPSWSDPRPPRQPYRDPPGRNMYPSLDAAPDRTFTSL
jgi:hypothetical protein